MNPVQADKCWARRFGRTSGDLGIVRSGKHYRMPVSLWKPVAVPPSFPRDPPAQPRTPNAAIPCPAPAGVEAEAGVHPVCHCGDDAQRHYALIARDLIAQGREVELTEPTR